MIASLLEDIDKHKNKIIATENKIKQLRNLVWSYDIPNPTIPEYKEHHNQIQTILKFIDTELLEEE